MADMQQIETAIGQRDAIPIAPPICYPLLQFFARHNFLMDGCAHFDVPTASLVLTSHRRRLVQGR